MPAFDSVPSLGPSDEKIPLTVTTADESTEIFVMDANFKRIASACGKLDIWLEPGVYKLKVRVGMKAREEHVVIMPGGKPITKHFDLVPFGSPAPLDHTLKTHEFHIRNAEQESRQVHVRDGSRSSIYVFLRDWTTKNLPSNAPAGAHPAEGLFLCDLEGKIVADFVKSSKTEHRADPWSACNVVVDPGIYRLKLVRPSFQLEQTVVACAGWQTQVFALQRDCGKEGHKCTDLAHAAIFMARDGVGFVSNARGQRLSELARLGLSNRRMVLSKEQRHELLSGKFHDPMLGIYGAHLLILSGGSDLQTSLHEIVANLRRLLVTPHPDVESLAQKLEDKRSDYIFTAPPMLSRSWTLVIEASVGRPGLVPLGSLADRATDHLLGEEPWLISWTDREDASRAPSSEKATPDLPDIKEMVKSYLREITLPHRIQRLGSPASLPRRLAAVGMGGESVKHASVQSWWSSKIDSNEIKHLVETFRIPRARLESMLTELTATGKEQAPTIATSSDPPR